MMKPETEVLHLIIPINIQSFSDVITNSSSELFCIISGNEDILDFIKDLLSNLMDTEGYDEDYPSFEVFKKEDLYKSDYDTKIWKNMPEIGIKVYLPYNLWNYEIFFREGLKALLENSEVKGKYKLDFNG